MRVRLFIASVCLLALLPGPPPLHGQALEPIEIALGEWRPFVTQHQDGYGEIPERVTLILEKMGYRPRYVFMPWGQAERLVAANGRNTGPRATVPFRKTDERLQDFLFSAQPIFERCIRFFYNKRKITRPEGVSIGAVDDLAGFRIGYVSQAGGYQYPPRLADVLDHRPNTAYRSLYEAFEALVAPDPSVQVVPAVPEVGEELLYEFFPEQRFDIAVIEETPPGNRDTCLLPTHYYFLTSKRNPNNTEFMRQFNREHAQIEAETAELLARIRQRASERATARTPAVTLDAGDTPETIQGQDDEGHLYPLPRGTEGLLLEWRAEPGTSSVQATVKIISGPYRGKVLSVEGKYVKLI